MLGYVDGNVDGTFAPDADVTNEEAIKLILNVLGYDPMAANNGGYPTGYLIVAADLSLTKGVAGIVGSEAATRGTVAMLVNHALDTPIMKYIETEGEAGQYVVCDGKQFELETLDMIYYEQ